MSSLSTMPGSPQPVQAQVMHANSPGTVQVISTGKPTRRPRPNKPKPAHRSRKPKRPAKQGLPQGCNQRPCGQYMPKPGAPANSTPTTKAEIPTAEGSVTISAEPAASKAARLGKMALVGGGITLAIIAAKSILGASSKNTKGLSGPDTKRKAGRPKGSKDKKPRKRRGSPKSNHLHLEV